MSDIAEQVALRMRDRVRAYEGFVIAAKEKVKVIERELTISSVVAMIDLVTAALESNVLL